MISRFQQVQTDDRNLNQVQQNLAKSINPLFVNPIINGNLLPAGLSRSESFSCRSNLLSSYFVCIYSRRSSACAGAKPYRSFMKPASLPAISAGTSSKQAPDIYAGGADVSSAPSLKYTVLSFLPHTDANSSIFSAISIRSIPCVSKKDMSSG